MAEANYGLDIETSDDLIMPLPLTQDQISLLDEDDLTIEVSEDVIRKLYPEINIVPNTKATLIPIIPGITLYSYIRFFNAFSSAPAVDVYVNGKKIAENLGYRDFTEYLKAFPGYYRVSVFRTGETTNPLAITFINLIGYRVYTVVISGMGDKASLELINDNIRPLPKRTGFLRIIQLSPNAPAMDAYLDDSLVLADIGYLEVSRYLSVTPGAHNLKMRDMITGGVLVEEPAVEIQGGSAYTAYVVGDMNDRVGLQILVQLEGISYLDF